MDSGTTVTNQNYIHEEFQSRLSSVIVLNSSVRNFYLPSPSPELKDRTLQNYNLIFLGGVNLASHRNGITWIEGV
jgi:hypothetical protein